MTASAAAAVAGWLGIAPETVAERAKGELEALAKRLVPSAPSPAARLARRAAGTLLPLAPHALRRSATTVAKRVRERVAPPESTPVVQELPFVRLARRLANELGVALPSRGRVELSHDVDWPSCWELVPKLAELERARGLRSTFLFLAGDAYRIDRAVVHDLSREGFLIGVHGWTHDVAIGFRSREKIRDHLLRTRDALGVEARIYRAPGLGASPLLFEVLDELGFEVDGSLRVLGRGGSGTGTIFPYRVPGCVRLEERPLALQDDRLFRDLGLDDGQALPLVTEYLDAVLAAGGTFVWNAHPTLAAEHLSFTERLLDHVKSRAVAFGAPR